MANTEFLAVLHENVLGRTGAQAEIGYRAGQTDAGLDLVAVTQAQWAQVWG